MPKKGTKRRKSEDDKMESAQKAAMSAKKTPHRNQEPQSPKIEAQSVERSVSLTFEYVFEAARSMEANGLVVAALALLESALRQSTLGISPTEHAQLLIFTARTYRIYTENLQEPKRHACKAIQALPRHGPGASNRSRSLLAQAENLTCSVCGKIVLAECCFEEGLVFQSHSVLDDAMKSAREAKDEALMCWVQLLKFQFFAAAEDSVGAFAALEAVISDSRESASLCWKLSNLFKAHLQIRCGDVAAAKATLEALDTVGAPETWLSPTSVDQLVSMDFLTDQRLSYQSFLRVLCGMGHAEADIRVGEDAKGARVVVIEERKERHSGSIHCCVVGWPSGAEQAISTYLSQTGEGRESAATPPQTEARGVDVNLPKGTLETQATGSQDSGPSLHHGGGGTQSSSPVLLLLLEREVRYQLAKNDFASAQAKILQLTEHVEGLVRSGCEPRVVENSRCLCDCLLAQYFHRLGLVDEACRVLVRVEQSSATDCQLWALTYRVLILLESETVQCEQIEELNQRSLHICESITATPLQKAAVLHNRAKLLLRMSFGRDEQIASAKELLCAALQELEAAPSQAGLPLEAWVACAYSETVLQSILPGEEDAKRDEALFYLCRTHVKCHEAGDKWLELKVLRGLERGYLVAPNQSRVARASLSIKETRMRELETAVAAAVHTKDHAILASRNANQGRADGTGLSSEG